MEKDKYTIGKCQSCGKVTALKDGYCRDCDRKFDVPDVFKQIFKDMADNE